MAHYAFITDGIVTEVITGVDENIIQTDTDGTQVGGNTEAWETFYGNFRGQVCKRTSYNNNIRKQYASIGFSYDPVADVFIAPKPECGHKELFLNDLFQWNCQKCELDTKANLSND